MTLFPVLLMVVAADPSPAPEKNETMKALVKDAVEQKKPEGPDVEKLPFTPESIKQVVAYHQPKIQSCYEETLAVKNKAVEGVLKTHWAITPDGMVKGPRVEKKGTTLRDPKLHDCVVAVLSTMTFPKPGDKKDHPIDFPFNLKAVR